MLFLMTGFATRMQNEIIEYLLVENRVLRVRMGRKRLLLTNIERALLGSKAASGRPGACAMRCAMQVRT